eukprot:m.85660 g.85660  ORF g.85660 m.85660 type:complete len:347 (-) comp11403_c0_seq1:502-1542(-)
MAGWRGVAAAWRTVVLGVAFASPGASATATDSASPIILISSTPGFACSPLPYNSAQPTGCPGTPPTTTTSAAAGMSPPRPTSPSVPWISSPKPMRAVNSTSFRLAPGPSADRSARVGWWPSRARCSPGNRTTPSGYVGSPSVRRSLRRHRLLPRRRQCLPRQQRQRRCQPQPHALMPQPRPPRSHPASPRRGHPRLPGLQQSRSRQPPVGRPLSDSATRAPSARAKWRRAATPPRVSSCSSPRARRTPSFGTRFAPIRCTRFSSSAFGKVGWIPRSATTRGFFRPTARPPPPQSRPQPQPPPSQPPAAPAGPPQWHHRPSQPRCKHPLQSRLPPLRVTPPRWLPLE